MKKQMAMIIVALALGGCLQLGCQGRSRITNVGSVFIKWGMEVEAGQRAATTNSTASSESGIIVGDKAELPKDKDEDGNSGSTND